MAITIDEAIDLLAKMSKDYRNDSEIERDKEALNLGIEGLKGIRKVRKTFRPYVEVLLLGETEG